MDIARSALKGIIIILVGAVLPFVLMIVFVLSLGLMDGAISVLLGLSRLEIAARGS